MVQIQKIIKKQFVNETIVCADQLHIFVLQKGFGLLKINGQVFDFLIGRAYFLSPKTAFELNGYISAGYFIKVAATAYQKFILQNTFEAQNQWLSSVGNRVDLDWLNLDKFFAKLEHFNQTHHSQSEAERLRSLFALFITANSPVLIEDSVAHDEEILFNFKALVEKHFKANHNIDFYANELRLYPKDLNQICKKNTGKYAMDLVLERLMSEAEHLLLTTKTPVKSIANALGFVEPLHFATYFEKLNGKTPLAYRTS